MTSREHLENFMSSSDYQHLEVLYEDILENNDFSHVNEIYNDLIDEMGKDRPLFESSQDLKKEFESMRDIAFSLKEDLHTRKCMATALLDGLVVERIKTYAMNYDAPAILADEIHEEYLKWLEEDEEEI